MNLKLPEENRENLHCTGLSNDSIDMAPKTQATKAFTELYTISFDFSIFFSDFYEAIHTIMLF